MVHNILQSMTKLKADMHNLYFRVCKDPMTKWLKLPFIAMNDAIFVIMESWPLEWCSSDLVEMEKVTT